MVLTFGCRTPTCQHGNLFTVTSGCEDFRVAHSFPGKHHLVELGKLKWAFIKVPDPVRVSQIAELIQFSQQTDPVVNFLKDMLQVFALFAVAFRTEISGYC